MSRTLDVVRLSGDEYDNLLDERRNLAMLVQRMSRALDKPTGNTILARQAMDYLKRRGLNGEIMR